MTLYKMEQNLASTTESGNKHFADALVEKIKEQAILFSLFLLK